MTVTRLAAETAARAAADLRTVLARPHSEEFIRNAVAGARITVARALVHEHAERMVSRYAQRRWLASRAAYDQRVAAYHDLPETEPELLAALDALAMRDEAAA